MIYASDLAPIAIIALLVLLVVLSCGAAVIHDWIDLRRSTDAPLLASCANLPLRKWGPVVVHPDGSTGVCSAV